MGTGFRAPTPAEVFTSQPVGAGVDIIENTDLEAETSFSMETGVLYNPLPNLNLDIAFFRNKYDNFIEPTLLTTGDIQFINIVKSKIEGIDAVIDYNIYDIKLQLGYTYLWARDTEKDEPMKYRPRNTLYTGFNYSPYPFDFGVNFRYWSRVEAIDNALVEPPIALVPDGDLRVPVYITDITAGYYFDLYNTPMKIFVNAKNILNYNYVEFIGNLAPIRNVSISIETYF
jgi:iron complex outermembrane receptor protein